MCTCWTPPTFSNLGIILGTTTLISVSHWFSSGTWLFFITATTKNPDSHRLLIKRSVQSNVETESYLKVAVLTVSDWCQVLLFSPQIFKVTHVSLWISNSTVSASRAQFSERGKGTGESVEDMNSKFDSTLLPIVWPWQVTETFLSLGFLSLKIQIIITVFQRFCGDEIRWKYL